MYWTVIVLSGLLVLVLLALLVRVLIFASVLFFGAQFVATSNERLHIMLELADLKPTEKSIDVGSGDGKILCAVAQQGYRIEGVELNPFLVKKSRRLLKKNGLTALVTVTQGSFWDISVAGYDVVFVYGNKFLMPKLQEKFAHELRPGSRVISNYFTFPDWQVTRSKQDIHLYQR